MIRGLSRSLQFGLLIACTVVPPLLGYVTLKSMNMNDILYAVLLIASTVTLSFTGGYCGLGLAFKLDELTDKYVN